MSSPQVVPQITVFDYVYDQGGVALAGARVYATLQYNQAINLSPQVSIAPVRYYAETDSNGYWQFALTPNPSITPTGTTYLIQTPYNAYEISLPATAGPYQATSILANQPIVLTPSTSSVGALTVTGLLTAQAGLTVTGTVTLPANSLSESNVNGLTAALANTVNLTGTQTVGGAKTFTSLLTETAGEAVTGGLSTDTLTASGLITANGAVTATGLITANGGVVNFTKYKARMYLTGSVTYTYNVQTQVPFNNVDFDPNGNISVAGHSWTAPIAGYYYVHMNVAVSTSSSETLSVIPLIYRNGVEVKRAQVAAGTLGTGTNLGVPVSAILSLSLGDVITGYVFQVNSASANLSGPVGSNQAYMEFHYMSS